jgi:ABC-type sugar transport system, periplasmic component
MKSMKSSILGRTIACVLAASIVSVVGSTGAASAATGTSAGKTTITFWNTFTGSDADQLKKIVGEFNKKESGKIELDMSIISSTVFTQKVPVSIATRSAPDLIQLNVPDTYTYSQQKSLESLNDFFTKTGSKKSDFIPSSLAVGKASGVQYGIPMQVFDSTNMYWNKTLFKAAGLNPNSPPKTFTELEKDAVKLTVANKNQYGFGMCASAAPQAYAVFIRGNGGSVVNMSTKKSVLASGANMKTFTWLHKLLYTEGVSPKNTGGVDMDNLMQSGKIGIYFDGPWLLPGLKSHKVSYGIAQVPSGSKGASCILDGNLFAIPVGTSDTQKAAVYQFLKYWNTTSVAKEWSIGDGAVPYLYSVINDPAIKANADVSAFTKNMKAATGWDNGLTTAGKIDSDVLFPLIAELQTNINVTSAVNKASASINTLLKNEK